MRQGLASKLMTLMLAVAFAAVAVAPMDAEAKRLGSGRASGMQRQMPAKQADTSPPASPNNASNNATNNAAARPNQAAPANAAAPAAAQPAKRSWMGPIAGLAAGHQRKSRQAGGQDQALGWNRRVGQKIGK